VPIVASGGIPHRDGRRKVLAMGADAVAVARPLLAPRSNRPQPFWIGCSGSSDELLIACTAAAPRIWRHEAEGVTEIR